MYNVHNTFTTFGTLVLKILQCHPNQTVTFQVGRKCKKNHLCEIYEVNICYMDLDLVF